MQKLEFLYCIWNLNQKVLIVCISIKKREVSVWKLVRQYVRQRITDKNLKITPVYMWNSTLWEKVILYYSALFASIDKIFILGITLGTRL